MSSYCSTSSFRRVPILPKISAAFLSLLTTFLVYNRRYISTSWVFVLCRSTHRGRVLHKNLCKCLLISLYPLMSLSLSLYDGVHGVRGWAVWMYKYRGSDRCKGNDRENGMATVAEIFGDTRSIVFHLLLHLNTPNTCIQTYNTNKHGWYQRVSTYPCCLATSLHLAVATTSSYSSLPKPSRSYVHII